MNVLNNNYFAINLDMCGMIQTIVKRSRTFRSVGLLMFVLIWVKSADAFGQNSSKAPFIQPDAIHQARSQFQFNLILNQNRNIPVFFVQYSKDFVRQSVQQMLQGAFIKQPGIAFALKIDCRNFQLDLNGTLGICYGFDRKKAQQQEKSDLKLQSEKIHDNFFRFDFMAPNPSRIKQRGHELAKNHDVQNLRQMNNLFNDQFLAKVLRNEIPDFVVYIEDSYDMEDFLQTKSQFRTAKRAKILFFDQNLQAPLFLKKLAARLDGKIKIGVTDSFKLAKKFEAHQDSVLLMQYNFDNKNYNTSKITFQQGNELNSILNSNNLARHLKLKKTRDMMLDFQHKDSTIYNMSSLSQINQLITHGRIIILQISSQENNHNCQALREIAQIYQVLLNYICFSKNKVNLLESAGLQIRNNSSSIYVIDKTLRSARLVSYLSQLFDIYEHLPQIPPRQKISVQSQAQMCIQTALTSKRDPVIYWYNQKKHKNTLSLLQYFNSMPQITSLIYFCQIYLPDKSLIKKYDLHQNCLFSMVPHQGGQMHKLQFKQALEFFPIKMFLRQLSINQMMKVYSQKLSKNNLVQIKSAQQLTKQCFNKQCIIGLMASNKFRFESQMQTLRQLKLYDSQTEFNFVWIDGICRWDVPKQLKLLQNKQKQVDRSYIFYYKQKSNQYALMKSIQENKYWVKKDVKKWLKNLREPGSIKRLKFGIDIEDKRCQVNNDTKKQPQTQSKHKANRQRKATDIKQQQL